MQASRSLWAPILLNLPFSPFTRKITSGAISESGEMKLSQSTWQSCPVMLIAVKRVLSVLVDLMKCLSLDFIIFGSTMKCYCPSPKGMFDVMVSKSVHVQ